MTGLSPIATQAVEQSADGSTRKELHIFELYGQPIDLPCEQPICTIVAVQNFYRSVERDWAAYWLPFDSGDPSGLYIEQRTEIVRKTGTKLPKDVACAMFPRLSPESYRE